MMLPPAQIEEATKIATGVNWTLASFAIFVLLVTWAAFGWLIRAMAKRRDADVKGLVKERNEAEAGWRKDLQDQVVKRGEDAERVESGLSDSAGATRDQGTKIDGLCMRVEALERRIEKIDRRTETMLDIIRQRHPRTED